MNIINNGKFIFKKKGTLPKSIKNNKEFTFGIRSEVESPNGFTPPPGVFIPGHGAGSMHKIIGHSNNLVEDMIKKI